MGSRQGTRLFLVDSWGAIWALSLDLDAKPRCHFKAICCSRAQSKVARLQHRVTEADAAIAKRNRSTFGAPYEFVRAIRHDSSALEGLDLVVEDPLHYLARIEEKPNALYHAVALQGWDLPETFQQLRHLLEAGMSNRGKREFIQVLRLMEALPREVVCFAIGELRYNDLEPATNLGWNMPLTHRFHRHGPP